MNKKLTPERLASIEYDEFPDVKDLSSHIFYLYSRISELEAGLEMLLDAHMTVDDATVPKAGIDSAPWQVVFNWSCSYARIKQARELLSPKDTQGEK